MERPHQSVVYQLDRMGGNQSSFRPREDANEPPIVIHVDSDFEDDNGDHDIYDDGVSVGWSNPIQIPRSPFEKQAVSVDEIDEIVSMYLGPKMSYDASQATTATITREYISQISKLSSAVGGMLSQFCLRKRLTHFILEL